MKDLPPRRCARLVSRSGTRQFSLHRRQRGVTSLMLLFLLVPLLLAVGVAVDLARMVQFRSDLQNAVDEAALAGATAFVASTQTTDASNAASNYFKRAILPVSLSVSAPSISTSATGTINPALGTQLAHTVTVSATANVPTTLLALVAPAMATISATATAANPVVTGKPQFPNTTYYACDGNTAYLYQVPPNATNTGYDYSSVPAFNTTNYYFIGSSYAGKSSSTQPPPTFSANQPLGIMLQNDTNGNYGNSTCKATVTGANSWGAPNGASQTFYSSLIMNGQSPSELSNYTYTAAITTTGSTAVATPTTYTTVTGGTSRHPTSTTTSSQGTPTTTTTNNGMSAYKVVIPANLLSPNGKTVSGTPSSFPSGSDPYAMVFGVNSPNNATSSCKITSTTTTNGSSTSNTTTGPTTTNGSTSTYTSTTTVTTATTTVTNYSCPTQYRTSKNTTSASNCLLYVQTGPGVTSSYVSGLTSSSSAPSGVANTCYNTNQGGAQYSAPSCAQLSALASAGTSSNAVLPAAVFWWDDGGGVGPNEGFGTLSGNSHCSQLSSSGTPGYGEDCQYRNLVVTLQCAQSAGGSGTSNTSVVLTQ